MATHSENALEATQRDFETNDHFKILPSTWVQLKENFYGLCEEEFRYSNLVRIPKYVEMLNFISAGRESKYFSSLIGDTTNRIGEIQKEYGGHILDNYKDAIHNLVDYTNAFYPLHFTSPVYSGSVSQFNANTPALQIATTTKALNDIIFSHGPTPDDQLHAIYLNATITVDGRGTMPVQQWAQGAADLINDGGGDELRGFAMIKVGDFVLDDYRKRFANSVQLYKHFQENAFPQVQDSISRYREIQELKQTLRKVAETDYATRLKLSRYYIG